jgi:hypothetical protein
VNQQLLLTGFFFLFRGTILQTGVTKFHPDLSESLKSSGNFDPNWQLPGNGTGNDREENRFKTLI